MAQGDQQAFRSVFDHYWPQVYGTSLRLTRSPELARDLSQDIFLRLWENRERLSGVQHPDSYLYILSRNLVMDHLRKKVFSPENLDTLIGYFEGDMAGPAQKLELRELETTLRAAVDALPEKVGAVFRLSRYEGLTHEQIAAKLGISVVSSKTYIVRALEHIRRYMEEHSGELTVLLACLLIMD